MGGAPAAPFLGGELQPTPTPGDTSPVTSRDAGNRDSRPWLLWDGTCGFCCWCVEWALRRGAEHHFRISAYQDAPTPPVDEALSAACAKAVQVIHPDGQRESAGRAVLTVLKSLGWSGFVRVLRIPPLIWLVELGYRCVAANRPFLGRFASADPAVCRGLDPGAAGPGCALPGPPGASNAAPVAPPPE